MLRQNSIKLKVVKNWFKGSFFKVTGAIFLVVGIPCLSLYSLEQEGFFKIDKIALTVSVKSSQKVFVKPYLESLNQKLDAFKGQSLWKFSLKSVSMLLKEETWISEFRISRSWPSGLEIEIEPHHIAFLIQSKESHGLTEFYPVTDSANILKKVDSKQAPSVAVIRQDQFLKNQKIREGAIAILKSLPSAGKLQSAQVSEVGYDKKDGYWMSLVQSDMKIKFGEDQFEIKSTRVSQVMDYLENRDLKARVIDANLSKKVLVRLH